MGKDIKTKIVVSAVNFTSGGPLSVLLDCLGALKEYKNIHQFDVTVLVHRMALVSSFLNDFNFREFPLIKSSWLKRVNFEYYECRNIDREIKPAIWISLHDMSPNVSAEKQYVYCHNPSPFYKMKFKEVLLDFKFFLFNQFYKYLYRVNIKNNKYVIVQQNWLRNEFAKNYAVKTIVAYPTLEKNFKSSPLTFNETINKADDNFVFFFPSFPRVFKNFELILKAAIILAKSRTDFKLIITLKGNENKYSRALFAKYSSCQNIEFLGKLSRNEVYKQYETTDCLLFPSKLETWGLPISEFIPFNKPILLADIPYAHETVANYSKVKFFDPENAQTLSLLMSQLINGNLTYDENHIAKPNEPFFLNWDGLIPFLLESK